MLAKTNKIIKRVAIFGDADAKETDQSFVDAYNTAKLLAENGYIIVNGGGPGIMLAATLGAKAGGGRVEVILMKHKKVENFEGENLENIKMADKIIKTKNYPERLSKLVEVGEAFVVFNGGTGTLSEIGLTWIMAKFEYGNHEPLIFFGEQWQETIEELIKKMKYDSVEKKVYQVVYTPEEVLETIKERKGVKVEEEDKGLLGKIMNFFS